MKTVINQKLNEEKENKLFGQKRKQPEEPTTDSLTLTLNYDIPSCCFQHKKDSFLQLLQASLPKDRIKCKEYLQIIQNSNVHDLKALIQTRVLPAYRLRLIGSIIKIMIKQADVPKPFITPDLVLGLRNHLVDFCEQLSLPKEKQIPNDCHSTMVQNQKFSTLITVAQNEYEKLQKEKENELKSSTKEKEQEQEKQVGPKSNKIAKIEYNST